MRFRFVQRGLALDLACGSGRHVRALSKHTWTVGLDLSMELLAVAESEFAGAPYVRADIRELPFQDQAFDLVVNLFTSFGYFSSDSENRHVLDEVSRVLKRGGNLVIDYLNADQVRAELVPQDTCKVGNRLVTQIRRITPDGRYVEKEISADGFERTYMERVRLFEPDDIRCLLHDAGLDIDRELGDYAGGPIDGESPRAIFFAHRS
ncbi:MAG: class I SAM-dependent methyltransferase [Gemmatimonadaceae bacterium]